MSTLKKIWQTAFFLLLAAFPGFSQSLLEDANTLARCIDILENSQSPGDSATIQATSELIAILHHYDMSYSEDNIVAGTWEELKARYASNPLINGLLGDSLVLMIDDTESYATANARRFDLKVNTGAREKIMDKLYAEQAVSPVDYLSVPNVIARYQTPVFPPVQAMAISADMSNRNARKGIVSEAAIIQGLALFILDRAKDEVIINYLDRLLSEETPQLEMLFPTVMAEFRDVDFSYSDSFMARLRQGFYEDLQKLSLRLPLLFLEDDYFVSLQSDPVAYNLLALYSLISLVQFDMPIEEAVPATNRFLYESFSEKIKEVNLKLAETAFESQAYQSLIAEADSAVNQLKNIYRVLNNAEYTLDSTILDFKTTFGDAPYPPNVNEYIDESAYNLDVLFGKNEYFGLGLLPQLLKGELDEAYMLQYNSLGSYDKFFGAERSPSQWRAAGIELAQKLNGDWYNNRSIADIFYNWQEDITNYKLATDRWMEETDSIGAFIRAQDQYQAVLTALQDAIVRDKQFWSEKSELSHDNGLAFNALANLLDVNVFQNIELNAPLDAVLDPSINDNLDAYIFYQKKAQVEAVEERFIALDELLYAKNPDVFESSPLRLYLAGKTMTEPYAFVKAHIEELEQSLSTIHILLDSLEGDFAKLPAKARNNAKPILQTTELASNLMYCLQSNDPEQKWLTHGQLDTILDGGRNEAAFLGLMQQRLSRTNGVGPLSSDRLADLAQLTVRDLKMLPDPAAPDSIKARDTLAFFRKASFAVNMLNRLLELPLVADAKTGRYIPLKNRSDSLKLVAPMSEQTLNFIYYLNVKDHGKAISSLIRVFTSLDTSLIESKNNKKKKYEEEEVAERDTSLIKSKNNKTRTTIAYLQKYGDFIAGLIDARSSHAVENLLQQISDPPGSSRIKRKSPLTVSINAYLGGTFGQETWRGDALAEDEDFFSLAPTMPIGITLSGLFGQKQRSYSLFVSFIDLGSILVYQPQSVKAVDTDLTFKNMFKPGVQLHNNIKKSPFYWGLGWQYGPQYVEINKEKERIGSSRFFLSFGVDVPVRTLYQK
ncbi:MAG: hypothetical protein HUU34_16505 [Saprospiraceae bacterium]|nr:hypothetical protein [Saprospiraceae bacterium]